MVWGGRVLLAASAALLAACAAPNLRTSDVETQISEALSDQVGGAFAVTCPTKVPAEAGTGFACTVTDETSGDRLTVQVSVDDDSGAFSWRVGPVPTPGSSAGPTPAP